MGVIEVNNLIKKFGNSTVLKDISFSADKNIYGFVGPNGAGKSTTIKCLLDLLEPTSGEIKIFGENVRNNKKLRYRIGFALDNGGLFDNLSLYDNLYIFSTFYDVKKEDFTQRAEKYLRDFELWDKKDTLCGRASTGMRRKITLIRSFIHEPELLILDEPTANLDPTTQSYIREFLSDINKNYGISVFISSHNLYEIDQICSAVCLINNGEITLNDKLENIKSGFSYMRIKGVFEESLQNKILEISPDSVVRQYKRGKCFYIKTPVSARITPETIKSGIRFGDGAEIESIDNTIENIYLFHTL